jgi:Calcineurin-like phosphoesterase superfamily domain
MRVGLISDTHGLVRPEARAALKGSELTIHAGDIGTPEVPWRSLAADGNILQRLRGHAAAPVPPEHSWREPVRPNLPTSRSLGECWR